MITVLQLITEVRRLANEEPDFVYPHPSLSDAGLAYATCLYNAAGDLPACIFGRALANLGEPALPQTTEEGPDEHPAS